MGLFHICCCDTAVGLCRVRYRVHLLLLCVLYCLITQVVVTYGLLPLGPWKWNGNAAQGIMSLGRQSSRCMRLCAITGQANNNIVNMTDDVVMIRNELNNKKFIVPKTAIGLSTEDRWKLHLKNRVAEKALVDALVSDKEQVDQEYEAYQSVIQARKASVLQVNERFFHAINEQNIELMKSVWLDSNHSQVICTESATGYDRIIRLFGTKMSALNALNFTIDNTKLLYYGNLAIVSCEMEWIEKSITFVNHITNIFVRSAALDRYFLKAHLSSGVSSSEAAIDYNFALRSLYRDPAVVASSKKKETSLSEAKDALRKLLKDPNAAAALGLNSDEFSGGSSSGSHGPMPHNDDLMKMVFGDIINDANQKLASGSSGTADHHNPGKVVGTVVVPAADFLRLVNNQKHKSKAIESDKIDNIQQNNLNNSPLDSLLSDSSDLKIDDYAAMKVKELDAETKYEYACDCAKLIQYFRSNNKITEQENKKLLTDVITGNRVITAYVACGIFPFGAEVLLAILDNENDSSNSSSSKPQVNATTTTGTLSDHQQQQNRTNDMKEIVENLKRLIPSLDKRMVMNLLNKFEMKCHQIAEELSATPQEENDDATKDLH